MRVRSRRPRKGVIQFFGPAHPDTLEGRGDCFFFLPGTEHIKSRPQFYSPHISLPDFYGRPRKLRADWFLCGGSKKGILCGTHDVRDGNGNVVLNGLSKWCIYLGRSVWLVLINTWHQLKDKLSLIKTNVWNVNCFLLHIFLIFLF